MMIKNILFIVFLFVGSSSFSQSSSLGKSDPEAKKVLDDVSAKFKTYNSVVAHFTLKIENSSGKVLGSKAGVVKMKGPEYRISVSGQEIYSDGNTIWTLDKSANEVQITKADASASSITPQKMFTNFYDKDFLYKLNNESKKGGKTIQEVELTPVDKTKPFFKVILNIDKSSRSIISTKIYQKTGDRYTYTITSLKPNISLPQNLFVFNTKDYPKVEVVDLR